MRSLFLITPKVLQQHGPEAWGAAIRGEATLYTGQSVAGARPGRASETAFGHVTRFERYEESDALEAAAIAAFRRGALDRVVPVSEVDVMRAARIRERLGVPGQLVASAEAFRDKSLMKRKAWEGGLDVPRFARLSSGLDLVDFVRANGWPVVVKPVDGRGSAGVEVLRDEASAEHFLRRGHASSGRYTVEEFVRGPMYRVDGLYVEGRPVVMQVGRYFKDCLAFIEGETIGTHSLDPENPLLPRIERFARHLLEEALPLPPTSLFHLQVFHSPDDRIVLCEVACRLGGGVINEEVKAATGVDIKMSYVTACTSDAPSVDAPRTNAAGDLSARIIVPPKTGRLASIPDRCPFDWVDVYVPYGVVGRVYDGATMTNGEVAGLVFRGGSEEELRRRARELEGWFQERTEWAR